MGFISSLIRWLLKRNKHEDSYESPCPSVGDSSLQMGSLQSGEEAVSQRGRDGEAGSSETPSRCDGEVTVMFRDPVSEKRIETLHPKIAAEVLCLFNRANNMLLTGNAKARITSAFRSVQEQTALYAKGRTVAGKIVTNAKGGYSVHNYGLAFDFCLITDNGKYASWDYLKDYDGDLIPDWMEFVNLFKQYGYEWGGDWKSFKDRPHIQKTFGMTIEELRTLPKGSGTLAIYPDF